MDVNPRRGQWTIDIELATQLKAAGLQWVPVEHDFFAIPGVGMDDSVFVLSNLQAQTEVLKGWPAITFNGAVEWALDFVWTEEAIWLPTEAQLRVLLMEALGPAGAFHLEVTASECACVVQSADEQLRYAGASGSDAYARALLAVLG